MLHHTTPILISTYTIYIPRVLYTKFTAQYIEKKEETHKHTDTRIPVGFAYQKFIP